MTQISLFGTELVHELPVVAERTSCAECRALWWVWCGANRKHNSTKEFSNISMGEGWGTSLGIDFVNISLNSESSSDTSNTHHNFVS